MSTTTTNYKLVKPELTDPADITAMNPNWDTIDSELKGRALASHTHSASEISGGVIPVENGGTGASTASEALKKLGLTATATELNYMDGATGNIQEKLNTLEADINTSSIQVASATSTDGVAYTATIKNVTSLHTGLAIFFVPDKTSTSTTPTLNLNGIGVKNIRRKLSMGTASTAVGHQNTWFYSGKPSLLVYDGTQWIAEDFTKPCAVDLYGSVPVANGGTGANTAEGARTVLGITPENIGAAKEKHTHPMEDLLTGTLGIAGGGTGATTASQALANLGAAPASHNHSTSDITSGTLPINRGGTGSTSASSARSTLGITPANIGAVSKSGDSLNGYLNFGSSNTGLRWTTPNGTKIDMRPWNDYFQITLRNDSKGVSEYGAFGMDSEGNIAFTKALSITSGGTGAKTASEARTNLGITPSNIGAAPTTHTHTKSQISDFPTAMPASDVSAWAKAASKPTYTASEVGALPSTGGNVAGWLDFGNFTHGLRWSGKNGTLFELRPYVDSEIFQLVVTPPGEAGFGALTITPDGTPNFARALPITSGGTGAKTASEARTNLGVPEKQNDIVLTANLGGFGTGTSEGSWWKVWNIGDGTGNYPLALLPSQNGTQLLGTSEYKIKEVWANSYKSGTWDGNAIAVNKGGTGATTKSAARKNLGMEVQVGTVNDVGTSGVTVTFPTAFSGIPVVTATGGSENASVYVRDITATGFKVISGVGNNDSVQWQAIYVSN